MRNDPNLRFFAAWNVRDAAIYDERCDEAHTASWAFVFVLPGRN